MNDSLRVDVLDTVQDLAKNVEIVSLNHLSSGIPSVQPLSKSLMTKLSLKIENGSITISKTVGSLMTGSKDARFGEDTRNGFVLTIQCSFHPISGF